MFTAIVRRSSVRAALLAGAALLSACDQRGLSGRDEEWARLNQDFVVLRASHRGAVVRARDRQVAIDPAPGFCLADDSIETSARSVFLLIGDCAVEAPVTERRGARGELPLPRSIPGILTVSVSGDAGLEGGSSLDRLQAFLEGPEGRRMLGRGGSGQQVAVKESRQQDGAVFLYLEDQSDNVVPILSNHFWRAFIQLNGRLAVVTISGFRDRPLDRDEMLSYIVSQVQTLAAANVTPPDEPETLLARADTTATDARGGDVRTLIIGPRGRGCRVGHRRLPFSARRRTEDTEPP